MSSEDAVVFAIDAARMNDEAFLRLRLDGVEASARAAIETALRYLYFEDGPINLPRDRLLCAQQWLEPAERVVVRWLYTRTNGSLRKTYGQHALRAARRAYYKCERCGFGDVRALNIDHVHGRIAGTAFACLCANCHAIKSREQDWTGLKPQRAEP